MEVMAKNVKQICDIEELKSFTSNKKLLMVCSNHHCRIFSLEI